MASLAAGCYITPAGGDGQLGARTTIGLPTDAATRRETLLRTIDRLIDPSQPRHSRAVQVCALAIEIHIGESASLKAKRTVVKHLVETAKVRFGVAAAEVGFQDQWQRSQLAFAAVAGSVRHVEEVLDSVERFIWSHPEVTVIGSDRTWLDTAE